MALRSDYMPEAEVSLRVAFYLLDHNLANSDIDVAIDGAQVKTNGMIHFDIREFLANNKCNAMTRNISWQGTYCKSDKGFRIRIHSRPGKGDVVVRLKDGHMLRVESKKGPLSPSKSSVEYSLLREAIGQLMTVEETGENDILAVAVPKSSRFALLTARWRGAPLIRRLGIQLLTVDRDSGVEGFPR